MQAFCRLRYSRLLASVLLVALSGCIQTPLVERKVTLTAPHVAGKSLDVITTNGFITARQSDRADVLIDATIHAQTQERAAATTVVVERGAGETLVIRVAWPDGQAKSGEACDISIKIPDVIGVKLESDNGELNIAGLAGAADLSTLNGKIEVDGHDGPIVVGTTNGQIVINGATSSVEAGATNGMLDIALAPESSGPVDLGTTNGMIRLKVGPAFAGELAISTTLGLLSVDDDLPARCIEEGSNHAVLRFGEVEQGPTVQSSVSTTNGMIEIGTIAEKKSVN